MPRQDVALELFYDGGWHNIITDDKVFADTITVLRGQGSEGAAPRPCKITARLNNATDKFRTSNPESPLYGLAGLNTPVRVSVGESVRGVARMTSAACDETDDFRPYPPRGLAWTDLQAGGLLQTINQSSRPVASAIHRMVTRSTDPIAEYWPGEDPAGSVEAASAVGGTPMRPVTVVRYTDSTGAPIPPGGAPEFGRGSGVPGSQALPSFQGGGTLAASIRDVGFDGYAIDWVMQFQPGTEDSADVLRWRESGTYVMYTVNVVSGNVTVFHANAADAATFSSTGSANAVIDMYDGAPHHFRYQVAQDGSDYLAQLYVDGTLYATADNFVPGMAGTVGRPLSIEWNPGEATADAMPVAAGQTIVWASGQNGDQPPVFTAAAGHAGELAAVRFGRLIDEELGSGNYYVSDSWADSTPMGPQRPDTPPDLIRECVTTEDAFLFDHRTEAKLYFLCRRDRYNQTPAATLHVRDLPRRPKEVVDDLQPHNIVTAKQREGGEVTAEDSTSVMGTQDPPDGIGEQGRQTVDVNLADPDTELEQVAHWWLNKGTVPLPRYPNVTVNMIQLDADLIAEVEAVEVGSVIAIIGYREYVIRLLVLGIKEVIGTHTRTITFTCLPEQPWLAGVYDGDSAYSPRYDLATCTTSAAYGPSATTLVLGITSDDEEWSATQAYDLVIAGELIGVPVGGMAAKSGSSQTLTGAVRSKNGVRKTLPSGSAVRVATPGRWAH